MFITELRDGMVVTYRGGEDRLYFDEKFYTLRSDGRLYISSDKTKYNNDLTSKTHKSLDIVKVQYCDLTVYERVCYVDFVTAMTNGKVLKNSIISKDDTFTVNEVLDIMTRYSATSLQRLVLSKTWQIIN